MVSIRFASVMAAASLLLSVSAQGGSATASVTNPITTPTVTLPAKAIVEIGCFATGTPLENHGEYTFQTGGNCQLVCIEQKKAVFGMSDGANCWCGDLIPPKSSQVDNSTCDTNCPGDGKPGCGGPKLLWVALSGTSLNRVDYYEPKESSSSSTKPASSTSSAPATSSSAAPPPEDNKPNTVGIAVGVVVGVVGLAALCFGVWFFLRKRRQRQAEEDYRRNAANVSSFVAGGKMHDSGSSMNDSRIDPSFMDRRQSNGSIADNEDYSRRILKVTNV